METTIIVIVFALLGTACSVPAQVTIGDQVTTTLAGPDTAFPQFEEMPFLRGCSGVLSLSTHWFTVLVMLQTSGSMPLTGSTAL